MSGSAHPGRKRPKKHEEEEHENHERWLVSYADMVTLLMCLFIVLFAMSQVDKAKFAALAAGLSAELRRADHRAARHDARGLGARRAARAGRHRRRASRPARRPPRPRSTRPPRRPPPSGAKRVAAEAAGAYDELAAARDEIDAALDAAGYAGAARYEIDERGLVVHIVADAVLFDAEEAVLRPEGSAILDAVAPTLTGLPNVLRGRGPRQPPAGHRGRPVAVELGAVGLPRDHRAHLPGRRRRARAADVRRRLRRPPSRWCPITDPHGDHRQPPGRHRRPVQRFGRGERPPAGDRRRTPRSHAMSTKEKAAGDRRGRGQGRQEEAAPDPRSCVLLAAAGAAYFFLFSGSGEAAGRGAGVQRHLPRPRPGRGEPRRRWLPEDRRLPGADRGGRRRRRGRRAGRLQGHRPGHLHVLPGRTRPTSPAPGTPSRRPCSRRSSRPTPRTASSGDGHLLHRVRHPVARRAPSHPPFARPGRCPGRRPRSTSAGTPRPSVTPFPADRRRPGAAGQGRSRLRR